MPALSRLSAIVHTPPATLSAPWYGRIPDRMARLCDAIRLRVCVVPQRVRQHEARTHRPVVVLCGDWTVQRETGRMADGVWELVGRIYVTQILGVRFSIVSSSLSC